MKILILLLSLLAFQTRAVAQRDSPVWESYLDRLSIHHPVKPENATSLEFVWHKVGGAHEHKAHQVYLLAYLQENETEIMKLAKNPKWMEANDKKKREKKILDVLLEKQLAVVLRSKTAKRLPRDKNRIDAENLRGSFAFPFDFKLSNQKLFEVMRKLPGFDAKRSWLSGKRRWYEQQLKFLVFIPVNDSKYADKVARKDKGKYDFAYTMDGEAIAQYFRPLPYVFQFKAWPDGKAVLYIH